MTDLSVVKRLLVYRCFIKVSRNPACVMRLMLKEKGNPLIALKVVKPDYGYLVGCALSCSDHVGNRQAATCFVKVSIWQHAMASYRLKGTPFTTRESGLWLPVVCC